jgi:hypothetical protein
VVSPRLWVPTAHFGYGYVFIRLMINIPIDSDCHGLLTRTQTQFLPKSLGKSDCCRPGVLDLDSMHFGFGSGGVVRVAISQSLFQLWSVQYPGYVLCISEQHCIQDGSPQISKFVIVCLYLQSQDVWWIYLYIYTLFYILSTFGWDYQAAQKSRLHACGWTSSTWKWMCVWMLKAMPPHLMLKAR